MHLISVSYGYQLAPQNIAQYSRGCVGVEHMEYELHFFSEWRV